MWCVHCLSESLAHCRRSFTASFSSPETSTVEFTAYKGRVGKKKKGGREEGGEGGREGGEGGRNGENEEGREKREGDGGEGTCHQTLQVLYTYTHMHTHA